MTEQEGAPKGPIPDQVLNYLQPQVSSANDEVSLLDLWRVLVSYKWLIFVLTFLSICIGAGIAFWLPPVYRAEITLAPVSTEEGGRLSALAGELGGIASLAGINIGSGNTSTDQAIAVLKSRAFTDAFIKEEQLLPILFSDQWDSQKKTKQQEDQNEAPTLRQANQHKKKKKKTKTQKKKTKKKTKKNEKKDPK